MNKLLTFFSGALAALLLSSAPVVGAANHIVRGIDGYYFEKGADQLIRYPQNQITVTIIKEQSYDVLDKQYGEPNSKFKVKAYTTWSPDGSKCTMHIVDPKVDYAPQYIGHEFVHCMYGNFHEHQDGPGQ